MATEQDASLYLTSNDCPDG